MVGVSGGQWLRRRAWLVDLLFATGVFLYNLPILPGYATSNAHVPGLLLVSIALCAPYLLCRRFPLAVLGALLLAAFVHLLLGTPLLAADAMLLLGVYNVASRHVWQTSVPATALVVVWLLVAAVPRLGDDVLDIGELGVLVVVTIWVWTWGTLVRTRRVYIAGLRERAAQLERERETQARIVAGDERARIARELHDVVSHGLSVVVVMAGGAAQKVEAEPEQAKAAMLTVRDTGRTALADMRRMLGVLREKEPGSHAPQPGVTDMESLVDESHTAGLPVTLRVEGDLAGVPASIGLAAYRIVQEALTNVRKHAAGVRKVKTHVRRREGTLVVQVTDDGVEVVQPDPGGHGLIGMRERVAAHGGTLTAGRRPSGGFEVKAELPIGERT